MAELAGLGSVRGRDLLERGDAVYHDLTRRSLAQRGYSGPFVEPAASAGHLMAIAASSAFTLFEFFETDRAGAPATYPRPKRAWASSMGSWRR